MKSGLAAGFLLLAKLAQGAWRGVPIVEEVPITTARDTLQHRNLALSIQAHKAVVPERVGIHLIRKR